MAKKGLLYSIGVAGLGYVLCLGIGEASTPGSAHKNVNAAATAGMEAENGGGALVSNGIDNLAPIAASTRDAMAQSGIGNMFSQAPATGTNDPTQVPADPGATDQR
jgi:hypothetical protein